jgi:hypothetical protein
MRWSLPGLSLRSTGYGWRLVHDEFVVEEVALGQVFDRVFRSFSVSVIREVHRTGRSFYHWRSTVLETALNIACVSRQRSRATAQVVSPVPQRQAGETSSPLNEAVFFQIWGNNGQKSAFTLCQSSEVDFVCGLIIKKVHNILKAFFIFWWPCIFV